MKMKRILAVLLAGMMTATAFAGCGGETSNAGSGIKIPDFLKRG